jgi:alanyl-tRNA synthetase
MGGEPMTERLYYTDSYLRKFQARVIERSADGQTVYLDRTLFYPTSGGQPFDTGLLGGVAVVDVVDEEDRIAHVLAAPLSSDRDQSGDPELSGEIDWARRFDHMQQHSGQHLLSAIFEEAFNLHTVSFHLGAENATIDLEGAGLNSQTLNSQTVAAAERLVNEAVFANRPLSVQFQEASQAQGLRKPSERDGVLRIVSIDGLDRSACGGTHVRSTAEIGAVLLRKVEKIRQSMRVEFVCGSRAVRRARADFEALSKVAQLFSAPLDEAAGMLATQLESAKAAEKSRRKLELELAAYRGKELYTATEPGADSLRRAVQRLERGNLEDLRAVAQNFTAQAKSVFVATLGDPPSVLLAASADSGIDAGKLLKLALTEAGGRGGGNPRIAQGSVPDAALLDGLVAKLS